MKLSWFVLAAAAFAQAPSPRLVTLHVIATDAQGARVTDLTAADLQVTDQGKAVQIAAFRNLAPRPAAPPAAREVNNTPPAALSHPMVILFDLLSISTGSRQPAIDQMVRSLEHMEAPDAVYFYVINLLGELVPVHAIPTAPPAAAAAPWTREIRALLEHATGPVAADENPIQRDILRRIEVTYAAFERLAAGLEPIPGRKNILWLTDGVPCVIQTSTTPWDCRPTLNRTAAKLVQAGIAVNPVVMENLGDTEVTSTYQQFTDLTGGKLYPPADIERAIAGSIELNRSSYMVQYAPPANAWDGKLHKVRVTSTRKGVTLQSTQGYMAEKAAPPAPNEQDRNRALFSAPFDDGDIPVSVLTSPAAQPKTVHLRITLDPRDLLLLPQNDRFALQVTLHVAAYLPGNRMQAYDPTVVNVGLTAEQRDKMMRDGIHLGNDVLIPEGVERIRLLVVDRAANRVGTVTIPVK